MIELKSENSMKLEIVKKIKDKICEECIHG